MLKDYKDEVEFKKVQCSLYGKIGKMVGLEDEDDAVDIDRNKATTVAERFEEATKKGLIKIVHDPAGTAVGNARKE
jgi:hypothetical protein